MITDYAIVYGKTPAKLGAEVNRLIGEGWQPFGAPFLAEPAVVVQAMVKYAPESIAPATTPYSVMLTKGGE